MPKTKQSLPSISKAHIVKKGDLLIQFKVLIDECDALYLVLVEGLRDRCVVKVERFLLPNRQNATCFLS